MALRSGSILAIAAVLGGGAGLAYAMLVKPGRPAAQVTIDLPTSVGAPIKTREAKAEVAASRKEAPLLCNGEASPVAETADGRLFGHFRYGEPSPTDLVPPPAGFGGPNCPTIHRDMAASLTSLIAAARKDDPQIASAMTGISCFRSIERQRGIFCNPAKIKDRGIAGQAKWVAPPGYSEHATGLTIDFGARTVPQCHVHPCFKTTKTGQWLAKNARRFGFELSFPEGNGQGVSYEAWHYRCVGNDRAKAAFAPARAAFPAG